MIRLSMGDSVRYGVLVRVSGVDVRRIGQVCGVGNSWGASGSMIFDGVLVPRVVATKGYIYNFDFYGVDGCFCRKQSAFLPGKTIRCLRLAAGMFSTARLDRCVA